MPKCNSRTLTTTSGIPSSILHMPVAYSSVFIEAWAAEKNALVDRWQRNCYSRSLTNASYRLFSLKNLELVRGTSKSLVRNSTSVLFPFTLVCVSSWEGCFLVDLSVLTVFSFIITNNFQDLFLSSSLIIVGPTFFGMLAALTFPDFHLTSDILCEQNENYQSAQNFIACR